MVVLLGAPIFLQAGECVCQNGGRFLCCAEWSPIQLQLAVCRDLLNLQELTQLGLSTLHATIQIVIQITKRKPRFLQR